MRKLKNIEERVSAEKEAHETHDVLEESRQLKEHFKHILSYPSRRRLNLYIDEYVAKLAGKKVLDYGCGRGDASLNYLKHGATVYGVDIAHNYIDDAIRAASAAGFPPKLFTFEVMDAHKLRYASESFDVVIGNGILHHLDSDIAMAEIYRVLKPNGRVMLFEPLAGNPLLKMFRKLTPRARTKDERPFSGRDVRRLSNSSRWVTETIYCGIVEAPVAVITSMLLPSRPDNWLLRTADVLERWLHRYKVLLSWNQYILFNLVKKPGIAK